MAATTGPQLLEFIYAYCPLVSGLNTTLGIVIRDGVHGYIEDITSITYPDQYDMLQMTFNWYPGIPPIVAILAQPVTIAMTPVGFTAWYEQNISYISTLSENGPILAGWYNTLIQPVGTFQNAQAENANYVASNGYTIISYSAWTTGVGLNLTQLSTQAFEYLNQTSNGTEELEAYYNPNAQLNPVVPIPDWVWYILIGGGIIILLMVILRGFGGTSFITSVATAQKTGAERRQVEVKTSRLKKDKPESITEQNIRTKHEGGFHDVKETAGTKDRLKMQATREKKIEQTKARDAAKAKEASKKQAKESGLDEAVFHE